MNWLRPFRKMFTRPGAPVRRCAGAGRARLAVEEFEARLVPYAVLGGAWPSSQLVTISFVPDGTVIGTSGGSNVTSNLFSTFNAKFGSAAVWQNVILKAAQTWAQQTNLNFAVVADDGASLGSGAYQQGSPLHGDIRIGGYNFGSSVLANAYAPPPSNNYDIAGDIRFNTGQTFNINGASYDLFTVASHEIGHSLALGHSSIVSAQMYSGYGGVKTLTSDDIAGVRSIYGTPAQDSYDASGTNNTFATADDITSTVSGSTYTAVLADLELTGPSATSDVDYYKLTGAAPTQGGNVTVTVTSLGRSLLSPSLKVYAANQTTLLGSQSSTAYGASVSVTFSGLVSGSTFYIVVDGQNNTNEFGTGAYALTLKTGTTTPTVPPIVTTLANGTPQSSGGGIATHMDFETLANTTTQGDQTLSGARHVAMDNAGNFVVVWTSDNDGGGSGVYAQRFSAAGAKLGTEFRVNTTTANAQTEPSIAMNPTGEFVISWTSDSQDGNGRGVYAQRFSSAGTKFGSEFRVNTATANHQTEPSIAMTPSGSFVVTWTSDGQDGNGKGVYAQRFSSAGTKLGSEFRVNTATGNDQTEPSIAMNPTGEFVISWTSNSQDGNGRGVYAQRFSSAGTKLGGEFRVNSYTSDDQESSQVVMETSGNFTVVWQSEHQGPSSWAARGQQYSAAGTTLGGEFQIAAVDSVGQQYPSIALNGAGNMVVAWYGDAGIDSSGVYFQRFDTTTQSLEGADGHDLHPDGCPGCGRCSFGNVFETALNSGREGANPSASSEQSAVNGAQAEKMVADLPLTPGRAGVVRTGFFAAPQASGPSFNQDESVRVTPAQTFLVPVSTALASPTSASNRPVDLTADGSGGFWLSPKSDDLGTAFGGIWLDEMMS